MQQFLINTYQKLSLPPNIKRFLKERVPHALKQPNPALRSFGTIQDLYAWRIDDDIDTCLFLQNFYSIYYPELNTSTHLRVWCFDSAGKQVVEMEKNLARMQTLKISFKEWLNSEKSNLKMGTFMWQIYIPAEVAARPECVKEHAYFTDRGYVAFVKNGIQHSFFHGVDRYAVFQRNQSSSFDFYYHSNHSYEWEPEIPLGSALESDRLDVISVNRLQKKVDIQIKIYDANQKEIYSAGQMVAPRGLFLQTLDSSVLKILGTDQGRMRMAGLSTQWSRAILFRHCKNGSISAMHC